MNYSGIQIQGNIISGEILDKIQLAEDYKFQKPKDFGFKSSEDLRDEIGIAWHDIRQLYERFHQKIENARASDDGKKATDLWIRNFLDYLGYEIKDANPQVINDKTYNISHKAKNDCNVPIHIVGAKLIEGEIVLLDQTLERGQRTPHNLLQEYLNNTENLYGIVTNGYQLRLLRDATRLTKLTYLEFDLKKIIEDELYLEFVLLYRILHKTRAPKSIEDNESSYWEVFHADALSSGSRIREKLSSAVEKSIIQLANGFLQHPENLALKNQVDNYVNSEDAVYRSQQQTEFYHNLLRIVYRLLFLMVTEERDLIFPSHENKSWDKRIQKKKKIYYDYYSVSRIKKLVEKKHFIEKRPHDLWESLKMCFAIFEKQEVAEEFGLNALASGLFSTDALGTLYDVKLSNEVFLEVLANLSYFQNEKKQLTRVNFTDLDVEEFGSMYEGLLEYQPVIKVEGNKYKFQFEKSEERSSSGSHYTPEELVRPLINHSLKYQVEDRLKDPDQFISTTKELNHLKKQEMALLGLRVCDVACGSGHILLSAARYIAFELAVVRTDQEQPNNEAIRLATRDVIKNCIYGVDLNPLAVELCKVALWLEAHNPNEPLNFLDHHIKCGNAIVGLAHMEELNKGIANEAFKKLAGDTPIASEFSKRNKAERKLFEEEIKSVGHQKTLDNQKSLEDSIKLVTAEFRKFGNMPETTSGEIKQKAEAYKKLEKGVHWFRLKQLADMQIAQFFIPKNETTRDQLVTQKSYQSFLKTGAQITGRGPAKASAIAEEKKFFHWFLEFPQIMSKGGFDCILGNPPFLGGQKLSSSFGDDFLGFIKYYYAPIGSVDLVTYFFRRDFEIIKRGGFQSLISTNTVAQGSAREGGLAVIEERGGTINHAVRSMKWPGIAVVEVALVTVHKGDWLRKYTLDNREVDLINSYLDDQEDLGDPYVLIRNQDISFQGSIVLGKGFVLEPQEAQNLIDKDPKNKEVLFPYLNGQDLNNNIDQSSSRWVINFFDWDEEKAKLYPDLYQIIKQKVKPERDKLRDNPDGRRRKKNWWLYGRNPIKLYKTIKPLERVLVVAQVSKTVAFTYVPANQVISMMCIVIAEEKGISFPLLQSSFHKDWVQKYGSALKNDTRYTPSDVYENFPYPEIKGEDYNKLEQLGEDYYNKRSRFMLSFGLGLTKTYNQFHNKDLQLEVVNQKKKDFEKVYGKETWNLYNHLENKKEGKVSYQEAVALIEELRQLHVHMDQAVLEAYGWRDIQPRHDFYEVEYLPENDRVRYTIHPDARKEVLKRLLLLNHEIHEKEVAEGLVKGAKPKKTEAKKKTPKKKAPSKSPSQQTSMFGGTSQPQTSLFEKKPTEISINTKFSIQKEDQSPMKYQMVQTAVKGEIKDGYRQIDIQSALGQKVFNRPVGFTFDFGGEWKIVSIDG
ncbi:DNA methyltransferase [Flammeovirga sp. EKP202]|uniref:Eco57I restriction-modification methylase domain-containing protein n=1 Tax=Flammeovirga sp. EKP202 TaxID=2770592 RepID=UPI00165FFAF9|nr:DNA methyltransferase [Flammeovirga sp. EKP202]MBD0403241.1 restriction endonuclease [Flammeovirga sp. EKP202]